MDFKFTFEDGSEAIAHYGVKGMKWKKHKFGQDDEQPSDFDARDYGFEDNSITSRRYARGSQFGLAAENNRMSREGALRKAEEHRKEAIDNPVFARKHPDGTPMTKAERMKIINKSYEKDVAMAKSFKSRKQLQQERKRRNDYMAETRANKAEFAGDEEGLRRAQKRTDAFYGRRGGKEGKRAQATEAQRRRRSADRLAAALKSQGMKRGSDGVWRKA